jgi:hypothetical protein
VPATAKPGEVSTFHIEHRVGNRHVGGSSYEFRVREKERERGGGKAVGRRGRKTGNRVR